MAPVIAPTLQPGTAPTTKPAKHPPTAPDTAPVLILTAHPLATSPHESEFLVNASDSMGQGGIIFFTSWEPSISADYLARNSVIRGYY